jgi:hypothetical protein
LNGETRAEYEKNIKYDKKKKHTQIKSDDFLKKKSTTVEVCCFTIYQSRVLTFNKTQDSPVRFEMRRFHAKDLHAELFQQAALIKRTISKKDVIWSFKF